MEILLAKSAGFCFGVQRAVDMAFEAETSKKTYTLGHIIHNETVMKQLSDKGIESVQTLSDAPMDRVIIRAHGVPEVIYEEAKEKSVEVIDATCPYVTKIHKLVSRYEKQGYGIILIGDAKHPEIIGINGWTKKGCIIFKDKESIDLTQLNKDSHYLVVSQTTYKRALVDEMVNYLEEAGYQVEFINTICNATSERQDEARQIASQVECMIVIGSQLSSNTQKLYEICKQICPHTYCIDDASSIDKEWFVNIHKVGVTAGASTPNDVILAVLDQLKQMDH